MGKCHRFFVIGLVALCCSTVRGEDDVAINDGPLERYAASLPVLRAADSARIQAQVVADSPDDESEVASPDQPVFASQLPRQDELVALPNERPASMDVVPGLPVVPRLIDSTWYARFEYMDFSVNNRSLDQAPLYTVGYERRVGRERFRAELFGTQFASSVLFLPSNRYATTTDYLGGRTEYDLLFNPLGTSRFVFFGGVGSRFWLRNRSQFLAGRFLYDEVQRTWATFYPYVGMETRHDETRAVEAYGRARIGLLAITYEHLTQPDRSYFPGPGVTGQTEWGIRGERLSLSAYFEAFAFPKTSGPAVSLSSNMLLTVGLKAGYSF
jgi:hypothetical protein